MARQRALIARSKASGRPTGYAEQLLQTFLGSLAIFEDDLYRLQNEGEGKPLAHQWHMKLFHAF